MANAGAAQPNVGPWGSRGKGSKNRNSVQAGYSKKAPELKTTLVRRLLEHCRADHRPPAATDWVWVGQQREVGCLPKKARKSLASEVIGQAVALFKKEGA